MKTTTQIFENHNRDLKQSLIDDELPEAYYGCDPGDENFQKPLNKL